MTTVRIVAAIVDTARLTLYKPDGTTIILPQGDTRIRAIVDSATPQIIANGFADVDITVENDYQRFEKESNGGVKFFKIAKEKLKGFFGKKTPTTPVDNSEPVDQNVSAMAVGKVPAAPTPVMDKTTATLSAVDQIMQHAVPVTSEAFNENSVHIQRNIVEEDGNTPSDRRDSDIESSHTIVAVSNGQIIPGMERIKTQFTRAAKLGSTKGVEKFLQRLGAVINERSHSVEDLLKFMERGDLPIADDGSILIFKVLNKRGTEYRDVHSGNVTQWVGSYVHMDHSLVDHNRNNECSNGLHVARRGYVKSFGGDVCTLCKVNPEDVIAVPDYDANKMRVCGYHIIAELTKEQYDVIKKNQPISDAPGGAELLANALAGNHIGITSMVKITAHKGAKLETKKVEAPVAPVAPVEVKPAQALQNPDKETKAKAVNPKAVAQKVKKVAKKVAKTVKATPAPTPAPTAEKSLGSPRERIQKLLAVGITSQGVAQSVLKLKKEAKKGWGALGVSDAQVEQITKLAGE